MNIFTPTEMDQILKNANKQLPDNSGELSPYTTGYLISADSEDKLKSSSISESVLTNLFNTTGVSSVKATTVTGGTVNATDINVSGTLSLGGLTNFATGLTIDTDKIELLDNGMITAENLNIVGVGSFGGNIYSEAGLDIGGGNFTVDSAGSAMVQKATVKDTLTVEGSIIAVDTLLSLSTEEQSTNVSNDVSISSGATTGTYDTGEVYLRSGHSNGRDSGLVKISTGNSSIRHTGNLQLSTGDAINDSGDIDISTGSGSTQGDVNITGKTITLDGAVNVGTSSSSKIGFFGTAGTIRTIVSDISGTPSIEDLKNKINELLQIFHDNGLIDDGTG